MNLLSVDWDYFFEHKGGTADPDWHLYDWGHQDTGFFRDALWGTRASTFIANGRALPGTTGEEADFWKRFTFKKGAKLYLADSHACAASNEVCGRSRRAALARWTWGQVWNYDAHHDAGYAKGQVFKAATEGRWGCDDWMGLYSCFTHDLHVRYPRWAAWKLEAEPEPDCAVNREVDDGLSPTEPDGTPVVFDSVFVCRSGAWVPPWLDEDFARFVMRCPVNPVGRKTIQDLEHFPIRPWGEEELASAQKYADLLLDVHRQNQAARARAEAGR